MQNMINYYLEKLGLDKNRGEFIEVEGQSIFRIVLKNSNEFARIYSLLENADWLSLQDGDLSLQDEFTNFLYINDDISFSLKGNLLKDYYVLEMREI